MSWIGYLISGLIVGAIAKLLTPGRDPGGCLVTLILGIAGSMLAGFLGRSLGWYGENEPVGWIASTLGAIVILLIYRMFTKKKNA